jgi:WD40 repeat protein/energy-coupling factor transporter ATP-binding protein EcfA2
MSPNNTKLATVSPFPGLRPFRTEESHLFFGREGQIDEVLEKLENHRFVAILGSSGSGKSSFMFCGLIPSLQGGFMAKQGSNWRLISIRPGTKPIQNLAMGLLDKERYAGLSPSDLNLKLEYYQAILKASSLGLVELLAKVRQESDENILLLVDQFEEIFRFRSEDTDTLNESTAFVKMLVNAVKIKSQPYFVVLTMRSDFIGDCSIFNELTSLINDSHYLIPQLDRNQKRSVILGPVAVGGGVMSARLLQQLLNDLDENSDQLPILQHALMRTWDYWQQNRKDNEPIDLFHYEAIGKMESALSLHADEAFVELDEKQKLICEIMFKALTQKGSDGRGVRRPTSIKIIAQIARVSSQEVIEVVEHFRRPGRTFLMPPLGTAINEDTYLDISHESLMRIWSRLVTWVDEEYESSKMYLKLCDAAFLYQESKSGLWRPPDLNLAISWEEHEKPTLAWGIRLDPAYERTMSFLNSSKKAYDEEQRNLTRQRNIVITRNKIVAGVAVGVAIILLLLVLYGRAKELEAVKQSKIALHEKLRADSLLYLANDERAKAIEEQKRAEQEKLNAEKEKQKAEAEKLKAEEKEREANIERENAKKQEQKAKEEAQRAEIEAQNAKAQKENADLAAKEAKAQKENALAAKLDADKLRILALAQSMASKSEQIKDTITQLLLAKQAFNFHQKYQGPALQPEIYSGLYAANQKIQGQNFNLIKGHKNKISVLEFVQNTLYSISSEGKILKRNPESHNYDSLFNPDNSSLYTLKSVALFGNGKKAAFGCSDGKIRLVNTETKTYDKTIPASNYLVWALAINPKETQLAFSDADSTQITVLDLQTFDRKVVAQTQKQNKIRAFRWSDENEITALTLNGDVFVWNVNKTSINDPLFTNLGEKGYALAYSKGLIAAGFFSGKVVVYDRNKGDSEEYPGHVGWISDIAFSPDGKLMATASYDNHVQIWDLTNRSLPPLVLDDFKTWVTSVRFSPDGRSLYAGCRDGVIKKFSLQIDNFATQICDYLNSNNKPSSLGQKDWNRYVGETIEREAACP